MIKNFRTKALFDLYSPTFRSILGPREGGFSVTFPSLFLSKRDIPSIAF
jgi:hypothetical protein